MLIFGSAKPFTKGNITTRRKSTFQYNPRMFYAEINVIVLSILDQSKHHLLQLYTTSGVAGKKDHGTWVQLLLYSRTYGPGTQKSSIS